MKHPKIAEAVVIGAQDEIKGEIPVAFVTIKTEYLKDESVKNVEKETVQMVREEIGPVASFKQCHVVSRLPKTRSGKYLRNIVRKIFNRQSYDIPTTVEDIEVVYEIEEFIIQYHNSRASH